MKHVLVGIGDSDLSQDAPGPGCSAGESGIPVTLYWICFERKYPPPIDKLRTSWSASLLMHELRASRATGRRA